MKPTDAEFASEVEALLTDHGLDAAAARRQAEFCKTLMLENEQINLTGITDAHGMAVRHALDSLSAVEIIGEEALDSALVDLGSGGGVPGIPLALAMPERGGCARRIARAEGGGAGPNR